MKLKKKKNNFLRIKICLILLIFVWLINFDQFFDPSNKKLIGKMEDQVGLK